MSIKSESLSGLMKIRGFTEVDSGVFVGSAQTPAQDCELWGADGSVFEDEFDRWAETLETNQAEESRSFQ